MVLDIVLYGNPVLRKKAKIVTTFDDKLREFCKDLIETMHAHHGIGIAAPQVGVSSRIFVVDLTAPSEDKESYIEPLVVVNPELIFLSPSKTQVEQEGCLSIPSLYARVKRVKKVLLKGFDVYEKPFEMEAEDLLARIFQHENDHLDGILFTDKVLTGDKKTVDTFLKDFRETHA